MSKTPEEDWSEMLDVFCHGAGVVSEAQGRPLHGLIVVRVHCPDQENMAVAPSFLGLQGIPEGIEPLEVALNGALRSAERFGDMAGLTIKTVSLAEVKKQMAAQHARAEAHRMGRRPSGRRPR